MEKKIIFVPKTCPNCSQHLAVKFSGTYGYFCIRELFWWGKIDNYPKEE